MLDVTEAEEYMRQQHAQGLREGVREGLREGLREGVRLAHVVERKLARTLTDAEWEALSQKIVDDGAGSAADSVASLDADALARWLAPPRS